MRGRITWRGITLGTGSRFGIKTVEGWEDLPELVDRSEALSNDDGEDVGDLTVGARVVTAEGILFDRDATDRLVATLQAATTRRQALETITVEQFGRVLTAEARIVRRSLPQAMGYGVGWQTWSLQWRCPNPLRYALSAGDVPTGLPVASGGVTLPITLPATLGSGSSSGRIRLPNAGDAPYRPVLTIRGPLPNGFEVTHLETGRRLRYVGPLADGEVLTIDCRRRRVRLAGGTDRRGSLTVAQWLEVPGSTPTVPGGATLVWTSLGADTSTAALLTAVAPPAGAYL